VLLMGVFIIAWIVRAVQVAYPEYRLALLPLILTYAALFVLTWWVDPLFSLAVRRGWIK